MVRLSIDEGLWRRGVTTMLSPPEVHDEVETELRARLLELVAEGVDVVLDLSFWKRRMREDYRELPAPIGVVPGTIYLATDRETCLDRVRARRGARSDDFVLSEELVARR